MINNGGFDGNLVNNDWRPSILTATLTRNGWVAINGSKSLRCCSDWGKSLRNGQNF